MKAYLVGEEWWGNRNKPPPDKPICGFNNQLCITDSGLSVYVNI